MCPECLSDDIDVSEFDFGICPQTGYHDAGERFRCLACGATGDAADLVRDALQSWVLPGRLGGGWTGGTISPPSRAMKGCR
jgi:hypothetical protein